eukprot:NODE_26_length_40862_cov_0.679513.p25 type:complete len:152 gc:universal NODE_26_length_40862_cov_0.679513:31730-32185(+)
MLSRFSRFATTNAAAEVSGLKLYFASPGGAPYVDKVVKQVNLPGSSGDLGILADHVPIMEQLKAGTVDIIDDAKTDKYFIAGGFAFMHSNSKLNVVASEAFKLEDLELSTAEKCLVDARKKSESNEIDESTTGKVHVEVLESLVAALKDKK